jgi:integral membrane protein (TIGR01906 family)
MNQMPPLFLSILKFLVTLVIPLVLLMTAFRILMTPAYVNLEYRMPGFPADSYGFTQADRLKWAPVALDYLLNDQGVEFLSDLTFADGSPLYNERELSHMVDVKNLVQAGLKVWVGLLVILAGLGVWSWQGGWWRDYRLMLASGGKLTMMLIAALILFVLIAFSQVFTLFHRIFFEGSTWIFLFSDTLIRLFPLRFWQDAFIFAGVMTLGGGWALWYFLEKRLSG